MKRLSCFGRYVSINVLNGEKNSVKCYIEKAQTKKIYLNCSIFFFVLWHSLFTNVEIRSQCVLQKRRIKWKKFTSFFESTTNILHLTNSQTFWLIKFELFFNYLQNFEKLIRTELTCWSNDRSNQTVGFGGPYT